MNPARHFVVAMVSSLGVLSGTGAEPRLVSSSSGQFLVRGLPVEASAVAPRFPGPVDYLRLDPNVLAVSLERIKAALLEGFGLPDQWRGKVFVVVHPRLADDQPIAVTAIRHPDGWSYRLNLPEIVNREQYLRAAAGVILREIANRASAGRQVELPPWLLEGLIAPWLARPDPFLTPQMSAGTNGLAGRAALAGPFGSVGLRLASGANVVQRDRDALERSRATLRAEGPLTLDQLNLPGDDLLHGPGARQYRSCAHVFVYSLLRLDDGRACLRNMLESLSRYLNWQSAFLRAFHEHFPRLVDVDKWWSLQVVRVAGLEPHGQWSALDAMRQLEDILLTRVEVRETPDALPLSSLAPLQTILREWDFARQEPILRQKVGRISALLLRAPPETRDLAEEYGRVLAGYLQRRTTPARNVRRQPIEPSAHQVVRETLRDLDRLEARRAALQDRLAAGSSSDSRQAPWPAAGLNVGAVPGSTAR